MNLKPIIITGGAGFIGVNIAQALNRRGRKDLIVVDHLSGNPGKKRNLATLKYSAYYDKVDFRQLVAEGEVPAPEAIFHLGACSSTTESDAVYLESNNFLYTCELCEWALKVGARFIYASSAATYGNGSKGYSDDEALIPVLQPLNLYGWSKQKFDLWAIERQLTGAIAGVKYFNVYGPGEDHKGEMRSLVNKAYRQIIETGKVRLFKSYRDDYRHGEQMRDFVHVADASAVTLFFYDHPSVNGIFNCGTGEARTWIALANALFTAMGRKPVIEFIDMPETIRANYQYHTEAEMSKLRNAGYHAPFMSIESGILTYVRDYLSTTAF